MFRRAISRLVNSSPTEKLKFGIWLYFFLLIFEGALRKWFLPFLSTPLLIVRDPVALWVLYIAYKHRMFPKSVYISLMTFLAVVGIVTALGVGHGSLPVALFGARIMLIHFPFIFVMGSVFNREDVIKMMKVSLWISVPMVVLVAMQFYSPQSAWVNRGIGGSMEGSGFGGAGGYFRPPATFSFTTGNVQFYSMVAAFMFYFFMNSKEISKKLLLFSACAFILAIPLSISRSLLFNSGVTAIFTLLAIGGEPRYFKKIFTIAGILSLALLVMSQTSYFQEAFGAFSDRFTTANEEEGGARNILVTRYFGGMLSALELSDEQSFFGLGLGMGTSVGSQILGGQGKFYLISEDEWGRVIGELGPLFGLIMIILRISLSVSVAFKGYGRARKGDMLTWLLTSFGFMAIIQGQWAQPTSLGFTAVIGGLMLASLNPSDVKTIQKSNT